MAEQLRNADELQKNLAEFQDLQRQLQMVSSQKQQLIMQVEEIKMAENELAKSDKTIYRYVGPLLIETNKTDAGADLKDKRELFEMRVGVLEKQETKMRPKYDELRTGLEKALREGKLR
ncbi:MAG: prefoldin subunit beta [Candidatus Micrarchaeota archaeon]|nr:prefoldin subunit beta [Candidatus Micrarchaeota archaeon]